VRGSMAPHTHTLAHAVCGGARESRAGMRSVAACVQPSSRTVLHGDTGAETERDGVEVVLFRLKKRTRAFFEHHIITTSQDTAITAFSRGDRRGTVAASGLRRTRSGYAVDSSPLLQQEVIRR